MKKVSMLDLIDIKGMFSVKRHVLCFDILYNELYQMYIFGCAVGGLRKCR